MFVFGSGVLIGTQLNVPNPTPINFGLIQKVSVDTSVSVKELYGQYAFPVAVGSGTRKVTCKASLARFSAQALGRLWYNQIPALGSTVVAFAESHPIPGTGPFTITVGNNGSFRADQGVTYASNGNPLVCVASSPATGQYTVNNTTGVYTFSTGDAGVTVLITYSYTAIKSPVDELSEPRDRQPSRRSDVDLQRDVVLDRPNDERAVFCDAQPVRRQQVLVRHQHRGLRQARLRVPGIRECGGPGHVLQLRRPCVSEEPFDISLGGKTWSVPHLPFRAIKVIQPALFDVYLAAGGSSMSAESVARLSEAQLDRLAEATWRALAFVEPELSLANFLDLPFSVGELIQAFPSVARAAGLRPGRVEDQALPAHATQEASQSPGKLISTP